MNDTQPRFTVSPTLIGFVLAAALVIATCSVIVSQTESDNSINGHRVVQLGYGLPLAFTSATGSDTNPLNIFAYFDQASSPNNWRPLGYLSDVLLWAALIGVIVWQARVSISAYSFVGLVIAGIIFLLMMNLVFTFA